MNSSMSRCAMFRTLRVILVMRCSSSNSMTGSGRSKSMEPWSLRRGLRGRASSFLCGKRVANIVAAGALDLIDGLRATLRFIQNFGGERMREMMLADDDLGINAEIAGTPENLDDAAGRRCASVRIAQQLHVHDGSVQFIQPRDAPRSDAGFIRAAETQLLPQPGGQFVAARNLHLVLDSNIVRQDDILLGAVAKQTDHRWMRAAQDSNDAAFGTLRAGNAAQTLNLCQNVVAVHGVLNAVARNENIAVELRHR